MGHRSRSLLSLLLSTTLLLVASTALGDDYPDHPIRMIVPYGPGGVTDITARAVAPFIAQALGGTIFIENRPGGSTMIGTDAVVKARPDGYTLLLDSGAALAANPILFKTMPYDAAKDLAPVGLLAVVPYVLAVNPSLPVTSVQDFIALAKAKAGALNFSSAGNGSGNHLTAEMFMRAAGIKAQHIPYKSGGEMVTALVGNQVSFTLAALPSASSFINGGTIKALAVTSQQRSAALPNVPTLAETGIPGFNVTEWLAIFAPAATPPAIIARLNAATTKALQNPELIDKLKALGEDARGGSPADLDKTLKGDMARWATLAQDVKFELQ